jgi:mitochondrial chaperone BCS1
LVEEFTTRVPELVFNPAEILLFLLEYRQLPGEAIDNVEAWMTRIREER